MLAWESVDGGWVGCLSTELWGMPEVPKAVFHATEWIAAGFPTRVTGGSEQQAAAHPKSFCRRQTGDNEAGLQRARLWSPSYHYNLIRTDMGGDSALSAMGFHLALAALPPMLCGARLQRCLVPRATPPMALPVIEGDGTVEAEASYEGMEFEGMVGKELSADELSSCDDGLTFLRAATSAARAAGGMPSLRRAAATPLRASWSECYIESDDHVLLGSCEMRVTSAMLLFRVGFVG
jgi:hypothetical protein